MIFYIKVLFFIFELNNSCIFGESLKCTTCALDFRVALQVVQRNLRRYMNLRGWPWYRLWQKIKPLLQVSRVEDEIKVEFDRLQILSRFILYSFPIQNPRETKLLVKSPCWLWVKAVKSLILTNLFCHDNTTPYYEPYSLRPSLQLFLVYKGILCWTRWIK